MQNICASNADFILKTDECTDGRTNEQTDRQYIYIVASLFKKIEIKGEN